MNTLLLAAVLIAILVLLAVVVWAIRQVKAFFIPRGKDLPSPAGEIIDAAADVVTERIAGEINQFFISPGQDSDGNARLSRAGEVIDAAGKVFASYASQSISASMMANASGVARGMQAIENELQAGALVNSGNPFVSMAAGAFSKQLKKNPMLAAALQQLAAGAGKNGHGNSSDQSGNGKYKIS